MEMKLKSWLYASAAEVEMSGSECEEKLILRKGGGHLGSSAWGLRSLWHRLESKNKFKKRNRQMSWCNINLLKFLCRRSLNILVSTEALSQLWIHLIEH